MKSSNQSLLLKVALNTINQINQLIFKYVSLAFETMLNKRYALERNIANENLVQCYKEHLNERFLIVMIVC